MQSSFQDLNIPLHIHQFSKNNRNRFETLDDIAHQVEDTKLVDCISSPESLSDAMVSNTTNTLERTQ
jgi:hypothetical protein